MVYNLVNQILVVYVCYNLLSLKSFDFSNSVTKGVQVGGVAILMYAFAKQITRKGDNAKNAVSDILKGVINEASLPGTVNRILKEYSASSSTPTTAIKSIVKIIAETSKANESESATLGALVFKTLDTLLKNNSNTTTTTK
jgi:hypothetical protein